MWEKYLSRSARASAPWIAGGQHVAPSAGMEIFEHRVNPLNGLDGLPFHHGHLGGRVVFHYGVAPIEEDGWVEEGMHGTY